MRSFCPPTAPVLTLCSWFLLDRQEIRLDLNAAGFCDFKSNGGPLDPVDDSGNFIRPDAPDPETDLCKTKMEFETESAAAWIFSWATVVILGMAATIYFNLRGIKQLSQLGDYQERVMGEVTEARAAMMMEQAKVLAERNALESKISSEKAKLEARMAELGGDDAGKKKELKAKADKLDKKSKKNKKVADKKKKKGGVMVSNPLMLSDDE